MPGRYDVVGILGAAGYFERAIDARHARAQQSRLLGPRIFIVLRRPGWRLNLRNLSGSGNRERGTGRVFFRLPAPGSRFPTELAKVIHARPLSLRALPSELQCSFRIDRDCRQAPSSPARAWDSDSFRAARPSPSRSRACRSRTSSRRCRRTPVAQGAGVAVRETVNGPDVAALRFDGEHRAGVIGAAVDNHRACAAGATIADPLLPGDVEPSPHRVKQRHARLHLQLVPAAVDRQVIGTSPGPIGAGPCASASRTPATTAVAIEPAPTALKKSRRDTSSCLCFLCLLWPIDEEYARSCLR